MNPDRLCQSPVFLLVFMLLLSGCPTTTSVWLHNQEYYSAGTEFTEAYDMATAAKGNKGRYAGWVRQGTVAYDAYQFSGVLEGSGRILTILVPAEIVQKEKWPGLARQPAIVMETMGLRPQEAPAALIPGWRFSDDQEKNLATPQVLLLTVSLSGDGGCITRFDARSGCVVSYHAEVSLDWHARSRAIVALRQLHYLYAVPMDVLLLPLTATYIIFVGEH